MESQSRTIRGDWYAKDVDRHDAVNDLVETLRREQDYRERANLLALQLYGGANYAGLHGAQYSRYVGGQRLALNVVRAVCSTATSKIAKMKPRVVALTEGGSGPQRQRAQRLTKFIAGIFYETHLYAIGQRVFLDSAIFDEGAVHVFEEDDRVKIERVFPNELIVDDAEAINGEPRSIHRVRDIPREVVRSRWPGYDRQVLDAPRGDLVAAGSGWQPDMIRVTESHHLPTHAGKKDGHHSITIKTATLLDEPWEKDYLPYEVLRWDLMPLGWHGSGLARQLFRLQYEINMLLESIEQSLRLSRPYILCEREAHLNEAQLTNELWRVLEYDRGANPPSPVTPPIVHPQVIEQLDRLYERSFEITGISQLSAQSKKPEGLNSGKALREFNDIESERFQMASQRYEDFYLGVAEKAIDIARDIGGRRKNYRVKSPHKSAVDLIRWNEVDMDADSYVMRLMPTSFLPTTPAGKLATIEEMLQAGLVEKDEALAMLDYPDLEGIAGRRNAAINNIDRRIDLMLSEEPGYERPEPFDNLPLLKRRVVEAYQQAKLDGTPDVNLELLRRQIEDVDDLVAMAQPQSPTPPPGQEGAVPPGGEAPGGAPPGGGPPGMSPPPPPPTATM
jgi:hypothetical protein